VVTPNNKESPQFIIKKGETGYKSFHLPNEEEMSFNVRMFKKLQ